MKKYIITAPSFVPNSGGIIVLHRLCHLLNEAGQEDHLRLYGRDYKNRLKHVGFRGEIVNFAQSLSSEEISKFRLIHNEDIYFCSKPKEDNNNHV